MAISYHVEFLTVTIKDWKHLLNDELKQVIIDCLEWLVEKERCKIYGFVMMPNHMHLLWKIADDFERAKVQGALLSFTSHEFKKRLQNDQSELAAYKVNLIDRDFQFWQRDANVKECWGEDFLEQKLFYIHNNPLQAQWKLSDLPENYYWSSSSFYETGESAFNFLTHYKD